MHSSVTYQLLESVTGQWILVIEQDGIERPAVAYYTLAEALRAVESEYDDLEQVRLDAQRHGVMNVA